MKIETGNKKDFLSSVEEFNGNPELEDESLIKKKKSNSIDFTRLIVILLCLSVFSYSLLSLAETYKSNMKSDTLYEGLYSGFASVISGSFSASSGILPGKSNILPSSAYTPSKGGNFNTIQQSNTTSIKFQQALSKLEGLRSQNSDTTGYISISGTGINYPILQSDDNDYYLYRGFDKTDLRNGSIFYDFRCEPNPGDNQNLIVYGHNMSNGSMFQQLENYTEKEELLKDGTITIYAFDGIYTYEIFSVYFTDAYSDYLDIYFFNELDFIKWCEKRAELSLYKKEVNFDENSKIVSLSTCVNATSSGRIAVHGVLKNVER